MGNYATAADLLERFESDEHLAHLTDTADTTGASDSDRVDEAINHAEGEMNSYIGMRYLVPVAVATIGDAVLTAMLKSVCLDLAVFNLVKRPGIEVEDTVQRWHDGQIAWLEKLAKGQVVLPATATPASTSSRDPVAAYGTAGTGDDSQRVFSRRTHAGI